MNAADETHGARGKRRLIVAEKRRGARERNRKFVRVHLRAKISCCQRRRGRLAVDAQNISGAVYYCNHHRVRIGGLRGGLYERVDIAAVRLCTVGGRRRGIQRCLRRLRNRRALGPVTIAYTKNILLEIWISSFRRLGRPMKVPALLPHRQAPLKPETHRLNGLCENCNFVSRDRLRLWDFRSLAFTYREILASLGMTNKLLPQPVKPAPLQLANFQDTLIRQGYEQSRRTRIPTDRKCVSDRAAPRLCVSRRLWRRSRQTGCSK